MYNGTYGNEHGREQNGFLPSFVCTPLPQNIGETKVYKRNKTRIEMTA